MKLTKREVTLIAILLVAGLLYGTYALIVKPLQTRYFEFIDERNNIELQELELQTRLSQKSVLEKEQAEINETMLRLNKATIDPLIPELISNRLLDQLAENGIRSNGLTISQVGTLTGSQVSVISLEEKQGAAQGSQNNGEGQADTAETTEPGSDIAELARQNNPANQNAPEPDAVIGNLLTINMSFNGAYSQIYDFLAALEAENRAVTVSNVTMSMQSTTTAEGETPQPGSEPILSVSAVINYYSIEIPDRSKLPDDPYTRPVFEQPEGKDIPFR